MHSTKWTFILLVATLMGGVVVAQDPTADPAAAAATTPAPAAAPPPAAPAPAPGGTPPAAPPAAPAPGAPPAAPSSSNPLSTIPVDPLEDEDALLTQTEIGDPLIRAQMTLYYERVTSRLLGLSPSDNSKADKVNRRYPVFKLLDLARVVMQKTCPALSPELLTLATQTFVSVQLESLHVREPYLGYSAYQRIRLALERCVNDAKPHLFVAPTTASVTPTGGNDSNSTNSTNNQLFCRPNPLLTTSPVTLKKDGSSFNGSLPDWALGYVGAKINEPLIELTWKVLLNAHSYCYTRFSDYFNDHHTFTVAMVPLFTNQVQDIWLKEYDVSDGNKTVLYGGLLGDPLKLLTKVNDCVGASREAGSAYPWLINRPPRDKSFDWASGNY